MLLKILKPLRVIVSLVFFLLTLFIFIDFAAIFSVKMINALLYLQFFPSLLKFIDVLSLGAAGFLVVLLLTFFFGRIYCSTVCPLGTIQDMVIGLKTRLNHKKKLRYKKPKPILQFTILGVLIAVLFIFHSILLINLLDPFSLAGKIFNHLLRPLYLMGNNLLASGFQSMNNYLFYSVPVKIISLASFIFSTLVFIIIIFLAIYRERWYCNAICPLGGILRLVSKYALFKIQIHKDECTLCGSCVKVCKAGCIDIIHKNIDFECCVGCFNCIGACPQGGISYSMSECIKARMQECTKVNQQSSVAYRSSPITDSESRRNFLKTSLIGAAGVSGFLSAKEAIASGERIESVYPVMPPGSQSYWHYTANCTACHLCVSICPTHVLQPSLFEFGLSGIFQPKMDFTTSYCNFDCVRCGEVCPSSAIFPQKKEDKQRIQIGVSVFVKNICVVVEKKTACGACSEHCPTKAVEMVPYLDTLKIPKVDARICIGCGACEHVCPTKPQKAIFVESNLYHHITPKPRKKVEESKPLPGQKKKAEEDFPF